MNFWSNVRDLFWWGETDEWHELMSYKAGIQIRAELIPIWWRVHEQLSAKRGWHVTQIRTIYLDVGAAWILSPTMAVTTRVRAHLIYVIPSCVPILHPRDLMALKFTFFFQSQKEFFPSVVRTMLSENHAVHCTVICVQRSTDELGVQITKSQFLRQRVKTDRKRL